MIIATILSEEREGGAFGRDLAGGAGRRRLAQRDLIILDVCTYIYIYIYTYVCVSISLYIYIYTHIL